MISKEDFFRKYNKTEEDLISANISWKELTKISEDHKNNTTIFEKSIESFIFEISKINNIHSIKFRIKDSEHLIEKIIRKNKERIKNNNNSLINFKNYKNEITDLIGIRIFHLQMSYGIEIAKNLINSFQTIESNSDGKLNTYYYAKGDNLDYLVHELSDLKLIPKEHQHSYRSIHIILKISSSSGNNELPVEVQVRTLAQEIWAESDHMFRYPYRLDDKNIGILSNNLNVSTNIIDVLLENSLSLVNSFDQKDLEIKQYENLKKELYKNALNEIKNDKYTINSEKILKKYFTYFHENLRDYYDYNKISDCFNKDNKKIKTYLNDVLKVNPDNYYIYINLGKFNFLENNISEAIEFYKKAYELVPNNFDLILNIAYAYLDTKDFIEAENFFNKHKEITKDYVKYYFNLGNLYKEKNEIPKALNFFEKVLKIEPKHDITYYSISEIYLSMEDYSSALTNIEKAISNNQKNEYIELEKYILNKISNKNTSGSFIAKITLAAIVIYFLFKD